MVMGHSGDSECPTWAYSFRSPLPAARASMVNSAGLSTMQPVGSRPGPKAFTYAGQERRAGLGTGGGPVHWSPAQTDMGTRTPPCLGSSLVGLAECGQ